MSLVLDCSATLAWIYPDETTDAIRTVFETVQVQGCHVPGLWPLEVANALTMAVRRRRITSGFRNDALRAIKLYAIRIDSEASAAAWAGTLQLADRFSLTLYDAAYLELAERRALPLASLDTELRTTAQALGLTLLGL